MTSKYFFFFLLTILLPATASAAGILPECSINMNGVLTSPCNACDFILLIQNLLKFTYLYLIPFFAALYLAWGGILMLSAGLTASPAQYERGKAAITTTLKGILILLLAWLIIDTILKVAGARIATGSSNPQFFQPWNTVACHITPPPGGERIITIPTEIHIDPPPDLQCGSGETYKLVDGQNVCDPAVQAQIRAVYQSKVEGSSFRSYSGGNACSNGRMSSLSVVSDFQKEATGGASATRLQAIAIRESSGDPNAVHTDKDGKSSYGLMQVRPDTACATRTSGIPGCSQGRVSDEPAVREWLLRPQNNISIGAQYYRSLITKYGNSDLATAAYNGGPVANQPSVNCPGSKRWQCEWDNNDHTSPNTGYAVTRKYVPDVAASEQAILSGSCTP